jgi:hypothetical protein
MRDFTPEQKRHLRGTILKLLMARHDAQLSRMDDVALAQALQSLAYYGITIEAVVTMLQDLQDRGYARFIQRRGVFARRVFIEKIELTSEGRDLVEGNIDQDPAVEL